MMTQRCTDRDSEVRDTAWGRGMSRHSGRVKAVVLPDSERTTCVPSLHWLSLLSDGYRMVESDLRLS